MLRYVGLMWNLADPTAHASAQRLAQQLIESGTRWDMVFNTPGLQVLCTGHLTSALTAHLLARRSGVVLGTVFRGFSELGEIDLAREAIFTEEETDKILATGGRFLVEAYWGRYVAFINASPENMTWLLKDPTGRLPCYVTKCAGVSVVFSYMPDFVTLGARALSLNWSYVAARLALGSGRADDTGLDGVHEVLGGQCWEFHGGRDARHLYWNPAQLLTRNAIEDSGLAARLVRTTTRTCVQAWASKYPTFIHRLSGGLDSSIVLACLADAPSRPRVVSLTYYRPGGVSDERPWARLAVQRNGGEHVEQVREPHLDFGALSGMRRFACPPMTYSFLEIDAIERELTNRYSATAISTGDGGDSLFGSTAARFAVLDYARRQGFRPGLLRLASDVALLRNQTVWSVLSSTVRHDLFNYDADRTEHLRAARQLVHADVREPLLANRSSFTHPWFRASRLSPAASELLSFLTIPDVFYPPLSDPSEVSADPVFPLLSQPLVELCLRIPSYVHFDEGRDRGLARRAFSEDLPPAIVARTWKDRVQGFPEEILRANLPAIREILLEGILVKERYLDRGALEAALSDKQITGTVSVGEILDHVLVEAWLRSWSGRDGVRAPVSDQSHCLVI
jgi:asparagine synthase (glutamine-hydrolysing)